MRDKKKEVVVELERRWACARPRHKYEDHIKMSSVGKASERLYGILVLNKLCLKEQNFQLSNKIISSERKNVMKLLC